MSNITRFMLVLTTATFLPLFSQAQNNPDIEIAPVSDQGEPAEPPVTFVTQSPKDIYNTPYEMGGTGGDTPVVRVETMQPVEIAPTPDGDRGASDGTSVKTIKTIN